MEVVPSHTQRSFQKIWVRWAPHMFLLRHAGKNGAASFLVYLFIRWVVIIFWVMPILLLSGVLFLVSIPFLFLWIIGGLVLLLFRSERDWRFPLYMLADCAWEATYLALLPDIWLEKKL